MSGNPLDLVESFFSKMSSASAAGVPSDPVEQVFKRYLEIVCQPGVLLLVHKSLEPEGYRTPESDTYTWTFTRLCRYYEESERFVPVLLSQTLSELSSHQLMFRADDLSTRILKEFVSQLAGGDYATALTPVLNKLKAHELSPSQLTAKAKMVLSVLRSTAPPRQLAWFCTMMCQSISSYFPGYEKFALAGLFFLRYLSPFIIGFCNQAPAHVAEVYQKNALQVAKLIQSLANNIYTADAKPPDKHSSFFSAKNKQRMSDFLNLLSTSSLGPYFFLPDFYPQPSEIQEFVTILHGKSFAIRKSMQGPHFDQVRAAWTKWTMQVSSLLDGLSGKTPTAQRAFLYPSATTPSRSLIYSKSAEDHLIPSKSSLPSPAALSSSPSAGPSLSTPRILRSSSSDNLSSSPPSSSLLLKTPKVFRIQKASVLSGRSRASPMLGPSESSASRSHNPRSEAAAGTAKSPLALNASLLRAVPLDTPEALPSLFPTSAQITVWENRNVVEWLQANGLDEVVGPFVEQFINGTQLLQGSFSLREVPAETAKRFTHVYTQLRATAHYNFDGHSFQTPEDQILALKSMLFKLASLMPRQSPSPANSQ